VPPGNEQAMARAIGELLAGLPLADAIGRAARESIEARYSFDRMVGRFEELYALELAARRSHPARGHELLVR
jgi:glycosyltransferase involved in cell wall biosynthesis